MRARLLTGWRQLLTVLVFGAAHLAILHAPEAPLHAFEQQLTYFWLAGSALALVLAGAWIRRPLLAWLGGGLPPLRSGQAALLAATAALVLVYLLGHVPARFRQTQDEVNFVGVARAMSTQQRAEICFEGNAFEGHLVCDSFLHDPRPKAYPFLLSLGFSLLGPREALPFALNTLLFFLCGFLVFRLAREVDARFSTGLFSLLCFSLWPLALWWARTAGYEMLYLCLATLLVLLACFLPTLEGRGDAVEASAAAFAGLVAAFLAQTRLESPALVPFLLLPAWPYLWRRALPGIILIAVTAVADIPGTCAMRIFDFVAVTNLRGAPPPASLDSLVGHLRGNLGVVFNLAGLSPCPRVLTILGVAGLALLGAHWARGSAAPRGRLLVLTLLAWPVAQFLLISSGFTSDFRMYDQLRYVLTLYPPLSIGAGLAAAWLYDFAWAPTRAPLACALVIGFAVAESATVESEVPVNLLYGPAETNWLVERVKTYPPNAAFFFSRPQGPIVAGRASYAYEKLVRRDPKWWSWIQRRTDGELYYVRGYDCRPRPSEDTGPDVEPEDRPNCEAIENDYRLREVESRPIFDAYRIKILKILGTKDRD